MRADYMVLADAASAADGKLYIHGGGWDTVLTQAFPAVLTAGLGILLRVPWGETNEPHIVELDIHDADGQSVLPNPPGPLRGTVNVGRPAHIEPGDDQVIAFAIGLNGTKIERPGRYAIILQLDGKEGARAAFRMKQMQELQAVTDGAPGNNPGKPS